MLLRRAVDDQHRLALGEIDHAPAAVVGQPRRRPAAWPTTTCAPAWGRTPARGGSPSRPAEVSRSAPSANPPSCRRTDAGGRAYSTAGSQNVVRTFSWTLRAGSGPKFFTGRRRTAARRRPGLVGRRHVDAGPGSAAPSGRRPTRRISASRLLRSPAASRGTPQGSPTGRCGNRTDVHHAFLVPDCSRSCPSRASAGPGPTASSVDLERVPLPPQRDVELGIDRAGEEVGDLLGVRILPAAGHARAATEKRTGRTSGAVPRGGLPAMRWTASRAVSKALAPPRRSDIE